MRLIFDKDLPPDKIGEFINELKYTFGVNTGDINVYFNFASFKNTYELYDLNGKQIQKHINQYNYNEQLLEVKNTVAIPFYFNELIRTLTAPEDACSIEQVKKVAYLYLTYETGMFNNDVEEQILQILVHYKFDDLDKLIKCFPGFNFDKYVICNLAREYPETK